MLHKWVPVLLVAIIAASGCTAKDESTTNETMIPPVAPGAGFTEDTGGINGFTLDPEIAPIAGAQLQIQGTELVSSSAQDGSFSFSNVPPGEYAIVAQRIGYLAGQARVTVIAGSAVDDVSITLEPLSVVAPFYETTEFEGLITCSIGASVVVSEECGNGLGTPVGTVGKNDRNTIDWNNNVTTIDGLTAIFFELTWNPNSAAAQQLALHAAHNMVCTPACEWETLYCDVFKNYGPPIQTCEIQADDIGVEDPATDLPWSITARAWVSPTEGTQVPNVLLEQGFKMYRTDFFNMERPESFSAVPVA